MESPRHTRRTPTSLLIGLLLLGGCHAAPARTTTLPEDALTWHEPACEASTWRVRWSSESLPLPFGEPCALLVEALPRDGSAVPEDLELRVDAGMPEHGHGTLRRALVHAQGNGRFRVEGLYLHMPGDWTLYLDVGREGIYERVEVLIEAD